MTSLRESYTFKFFNMTMSPRDWNFGNLSSVGLKALILREFSDSVDDLFESDVWSTILKVHKRSRRQLETHIVTCDNPTCSLRLRDSRAIYNHSDDIHATIRLFHTLVASFRNRNEAIRNGRNLRRRMFRHYDDL